MSVENAVRKRTELVERLGKATLNVKYPDEFELYVIALELVDSKSTTLEYFIFPVMPNSIDENQPYINNIKKTQSGVSIMSSNNFNPVDINISGSFGRKFRVLLGTDYKDFVSSFKSESGKITKSSFKKGVKDFFDKRVKTGYGCYKVLEDIIKQSGQLDSYGGVKTLIFHNLALGNSYIVKPLSLRPSQTQESNMIWNYTLNMKGVADLKSLSSAKDLQEQRKRLVISGFTQSRVDGLLNTLTSF